MRSKRLERKRSSRAMRSRMSILLCVKFLQLRRRRSRFQVVSPGSPKKTRRMLLSRPWTLRPCRSKCSTASEPIRPLEPVTRIVFIQMSFLSHANLNDGGSGASHQGTGTTTGKGSRRCGVWIAQASDGNCGEDRRPAKHAWRFRASQISGGLRGVCNSPGLPRPAKRPPRRLDDSHSRDFDARRIRPPTHPQLKLRTNGRTREASCPIRDAQQRIRECFHEKGPCERQNSRSTAEAVGDSFELRVRALKRTTRAAKNRWVHVCPHPSGGPPPRRNRGDRKHAAGPGENHRAKGYRS